MISSSRSAQLLTASHNLPSCAIKVSVSWQAITIEKCLGESGTPRPSLGRGAQNNFRKLDSLHQISRTIIFQKGHVKAASCKADGPRHRYLRQAVTFAGRFSRESSTSRPFAGVQQTLRQNCKGLVQIRLKSLPATSCNQVPEEVLPLTHSLCRILIDVGPRSC